MDHYSGYFLSSGMGASANFFSTPCKAGPDGKFSAEHLSGKNILLAGGFPASSQDSPFPLSVTLQLNGDLTDLNTEAMAALARAELFRHNSQSFRSYTLEADRCITVLGSKPETLHNFLDTYDALLQINPILLDSYDPTLTTAVDLRIDAFQKGFKLSFNVRQPIDTNRCTYCGSCGTSCPEQCLTEKLFLDFSLCIFCNECISACSDNAIDLHSVEKRELTVPALLLLDGAEPDLPRQKDNIYSEASLASFFKTIFAAEVEEVIEWSAPACQYSPKLQTGCSVCMDSCQHSAISQNRNGVQINHLACVECGACLSSCPTGALQYKRFDDIRFLEYFRSFPLPSDTTIILGTERSLHRHWWYNPRERQNGVFFLEHPQPTALHAMHLLLLRAMGAGRIVILEEKEDTLSSQVKFSNALLLALQGQQPVYMLPPNKLHSFLAADYTTDNTVTCYHDFSYSNRRTKLLDIITFLIQQSNDVAVMTQGEYTEDFGEILCDENRCTQCLACVAECRVEALSADSDSYTLNHTPALCVQCGICITVCPESVLSSRKGLSLNEHFFRNKTIAQAEPARCKGCGKVFGTRKSLEKVIAILSTKKLWNPEDDLLSYCDSCRVVTLYESLEK